MSRSVFPLWAIFDAQVLPRGSASFFGVRAGFECAIALAWLALRSAQVGRRWPQASAFVLVAIPELAISWMIPRVGDHVAPYLLGLSLTIYASAFLIVWRWQLTALLVIFTGMSTTVFCIQANHPATRR